MEESLRIKMLQTNIFAKNIRDIYLRLNKNYSVYISEDITNKNEIDINKIFNKKILKEFKRDLEKLDKIKNKKKAYFNFSTDFNFEKNNRKIAQIRYGQKKVILSVKQRLSNKHEKIVSIGIGNGKTSSEYAKFMKKNDILIGVDLHKKYLDKAKNKIKNLKIIEFNLNSLNKENLPIQNNSIDIAECSMVAHHIFNFETLIKEVSRILKTKGNFIYFDLTDKTKTEKNMSFNHVHKHPEFHGIEFYRDHKYVKNNFKKNFTIIDYERIGSGLVFIEAEKFR
jgi:ubiquinone/menaquinone biosynthesis C-methylase UbiE